VYDLLPLDMCKVPINTGISSGAARAEANAVALLANMISQTALRLQVIFLVNPGFKTLPRQLYGLFIRISETVFTIVPCMLYLEGSVAHIIK
jgi:hypothetical protein